MSPRRVVSLSKTWNVNKLTSEISSSSSVISCCGAAVAGDGISVAARPVAADAPPDRASDNPAAPITGNAILRVFGFGVRFARAIVEPSYTIE
jgi:hypothetical protein